MIDPAQFVKTVTVVVVAAFAIAGPAGGGAAAGAPGISTQGEPQQGGEPAPPQGSERRQDPDEAEGFALTQQGAAGREGKSLRVGDTQFIFSDIMDFAGTANDVFIWAWLPTLTGDVGDNAFIGGQNVTVEADGTIGGDLFMFAQVGVIDGVVEGDLYGFVADLTISEGGRVGGAIYGSSGALTIDGTVEGPISFAGGAVALNGTLLGDARIEAGEMEIGPNARIEGDLHYESPRQADIHPDAQISGQLRYFEPESDEEAGEAAPASEPGWISSWSVLWTLWWFLGSFVVGVLALAIGGEPARRPAVCLSRQPALGLGFGFVVAVVIPAAVVLAVILLITIPLGVIAFLLYVVAVFLARLVTAQSVGDSLLRAARGGAEPSAYLSLAVGLAVLYALLQIPYVGFLVWLAAIVGGLGGIFLAIRRGSGGPDASRSLDGIGVVSARGTAS